MKNKATHYGTCQFCGSLQKLPDGVLAFHGYEIEWHQFTGGCSGSGRLPFEQSRDYALTCLANSEQFLLLHPAPAKPESDPHLLQRKNPETIAYWDKVRLRQMHQGIVRWMMPRCKKWAPRPLRPVEEVEAGRETIKIASRNIRELARLRDDAKDELIKLIESAGKQYGQYIHSFRVKKGEDWFREHCWLFPYPATNVVEKVCKLLAKRESDLNVTWNPTIAELRLAKAKFEAAKATHAEAKKAIDADRAAARAQLERKAA